MLLSTYYFPVIGGVESHARQVARQLTDRGLHITVFTKRLGPDTPASDTIDGVQVERLRPSGPRSRFAKWRLLPFALLALARRRPRPDVIFCPDFRGVGIAALLAGWLLRRPVVLQAETPGALSCQSWNDDLARLHVSPGGLVARAITWPFRRLYAAASLHICISRDIEREALACGIPETRLRCIPHGVDIARFRPAASDDERRAIREAEDLPLDRLVCLFVGRLSVEKGVLDLLEAWRMLADPDAILLLVGPDMPGHPLDAGPAARAFATRHGLTASVRFAGPRTDPSVLMRAADVFVQPSHYEGFPSSAIEAIAAGLPILATRVGGMKDYLVDGENALLTEPADPGGLAQGLTRLLQDGPLRARLRTNARETAVARFDQNLIADRYAETLRELAGVDPGRPFNN